MEGTCLSLYILISRKGFYVQKARSLDGRLADAGRLRQAQRFSHANGPTAYTNEYRYTFAADGHAHASTADGHAHASTTHSDAHASTADGHAQAASILGGSGHARRLA